MEAHLNVSGLRDAAVDVVVHRQLSVVGQPYNPRAVGGVGEVGGLVPVLEDEARVVAVLAHAVTVGGRRGLLEHERPKIFRTGAPRLVLGASAIGVHVAVGHRVLYLKRALCLFHDLSVP